MNDHITQILQRLKQCQNCKTTYLDTTKNKNQKYCTPKCRDHQENQRAKPRHQKWNKQHKWHKPKQLGTITLQTIDKHISHLMRQTT